MYRKRVMTQAQKDRRNELRRQRRQDPEYRISEYRRDANTPGYRAGALFHDIKRRAQKKNLEFSLTKEWIRQRLEKCAVTGLELVLDRTGENKTHPFAPSVDRIDSDRGYTPDNCQVVCWMYNAAKNRHTHEDVLRFAEALLSMGQGSIGQ